MKADKEQMFVATVCLVGVGTFAYSGLSTLFSVGELVEYGADNILSERGYALVCLSYSLIIPFIAYIKGVFSRGNTRKPTDKQTDQNRKA